MSWHYFIHVCIGLVPPIFAISDFGVYCLLFKFFVMFCVMCPIFYTLLAMTYFHSIALMFHTNSCHLCFTKTCGKTLQEITKHVPTATTLKRNLK